MKNFEKFKSFINDGLLNFLSNFDEEYTTKIIYNDYQYDIFIFINTINIEILDIQNILFYKCFLTEHVEDSNIEELYNDLQENNLVKDFIDVVSEIMVKII